jgi:DNA-binding NarL/FixJ family response regulator
MTLSEIVDVAYEAADRAIATMGDGEHAGGLDETAVRRTDRALTARERQVAQLLARDLSDRDIAERLSISPRTASTHVNTILGKLGVHSRREVAHLADMLGQNESSRDDQPLPAQPIK